jgi:cytidylate kinase
MATQAGHIVITIDGPAGSGKSTLARNLARALNITYLDTGATYRALAIKALREGANPDSEIIAARLAKAVHIEFKPSKAEKDGACVCLDGEDITGQLSANEVSVAASKLARHPAVREVMVDLQRRMAEEICCSEREDGGELVGVVAEGRDTGTVVFPDADVKIFLVASLEERAKRRAPDFGDGTFRVEYLMEIIKERDLRDASRPVGPLKAAEDAVMLDNTGCTMEETLGKAMEIVRGKVEGIA